MASESWSDGGAIGGAFVHGGRIPAERLPVRENPDGSYVAIWIPRTPGDYIFRCTLDDHPASQVRSMLSIDNVKILRLIFPAYLFYIRNRLAFIVLILVSYIGC